MSVDDLDVRKTYEINQLYQSDDPQLIYIAEKINEAEKYAFENCVIKDIPDYSIFSDIEKRAIELEEKRYKETKKLVKGIAKSILATSNKNSNYLIDYNIIQNQKKIEELIKKIPE
jgi:hypothetical protein